MEFRIKLCLYHYFIDYRKTCLLYIKKHIKTVEDLTNYISKHFNIDGEFYLTCNDFYLPCFEDIRVLNQDDVVVVVPQISQFKEVEREVTLKKVKKIKKKVAVVADEKKVDQNLSEPNEVLTKKKKFADDDLNMMVDELEIDEVDHAKGKKNRKKPSLVTDDEVTSKTNGIWQNLAREYTRKRKIEPLQISTSPNIIKSIVVQHNGSDHKNETSVTSDSDTCADDTQHDNKITDETDSKLDSITSENDLATNKVKRKRKRVRHKRKPPPIVPLLQPIVPVIPVIGSPSVHIRFDDDVANPKSESIANDYYEPEEKENEELINLEEDTPNQANYDVLCKSEIGTFPLMKGRNPNPNEVVAFKVFLFVENDSKKREKTLL